MAISVPGESRRMYSWWWDSHISPRNSRWLHENLSDMDRNIKEMIKLIEEDADSFARRAEMFYEKRPEMMQLMEEFYRSYRALAERYDHATGALHQAHETMAEAFPNQIPPMHDDPPSSTSDIEPHTPEMSSPLRAQMDSDDLQHGAFSVSSHFAYFEENNSLLSKKRLRQLNRAKFYEEKVKEKVLNFEEVDQNVEDKEDLKKEIKHLRKEISRLSTQNENLLSQMASDSLRTLTLDETIFKLESMKEDALLQYKFSLEKISSVESDISNIMRELGKVNDEIVLKLTSVEEQYLSMENVNRTLQLELGTQQKELQKSRINLEELNTSLEEEQQKRMQAEVALMSLEQIHTHSQDESQVLALEIHCNVEKLKEMEMSKVGLEKKITELKEIIGNLHEQNKSLDVKIKDLENELKLLEQTKERLECQLGIYLEENAKLQKEVSCLKGDRNGIEHSFLGLTEQMEAVLEKNVMLEKLLSDANFEMEGLREKVNALEASCETLLGEVSSNVAEKDVLLSKMETISLDMEGRLEKSTFLENSLSDANVELEGLRARFKDLEECCICLCDQNSRLLAERNTLISQVENIRESLKMVGAKYSELEYKNLNLEIEKGSALRRVLELEKSLTLERQEHHALKTHLDILQEETQAKEDEFEIEQEKSMLEGFILQRCLCDMKDQNMILYDECKKLLEAFKHSGKQISELQQECLLQHDESMLISEKSEKLRRGILLLLKELNINKECNGTCRIEDENLIQTMLHSIANTQEESQCLHLEIGVLFALLKHIGFEKLQIHHKLEILAKEVLSLQNKNNQVTEINRHLKAEMQISQAEFCSLLKERDSLLKRFYNLNEKLVVLEEENSDAFAEALRLDQLYIFYKSLSAERELKLKLLRDDVCCILAAKNCLDEETKFQNGRIRELEGEATGRRELEEEVKTLLLDISSKDREIANVLEANRLLCRKLNGLNYEVEVLRKKEGYLNSELQRKTSEVHKCEGEIRTLLNEIQVSTLNAAMLEEKVLELIRALESLEILSMSRREMLGKEIASKNACVDELKKKINDLKEENSTLKADLNAYLSLLTSLSEGISCVEEHIFSLSKLLGRQDDAESKKSSHQLKENESTKKTEGCLELHKLITKVETLQNLLIDSKNHLEQERLDSNANLEAAMKEIDNLKLKEALLQEISKEKYRQTMKDIQLDQVTSSCHSSCRESKNKKAESNDRMFGLREISESDDIEAVEEAIADKEPSIDKLEVFTKVNVSSPNKCNIMVIEKLNSDAQRLQVIQRSMHKLKMKLESAEEKNHIESSDYGTFKFQLIQTESAILEQVDTNGKLKKKFEDNSEPLNNVIWEKESKQISKNIGKLELELQNIEYNFLKVEEEEQNKRFGCGGGKSSIHLREYLHGKRKSRFCRCMRPKTKS